MKAKKKMEVSDEQYCDLMYLVESIHKIGFYLDDPAVDNRIKKSLAKAVKQLQTTGELINSVVEMRE